MNEQQKTNAYWVWLSMALGAGARTDEILAAFHTAQELYLADTRDRIVSGVFTRRQLERLQATTLDAALQAMALCEKNGWQVCTPEDPLYPAALRTLTDQPLALFADGDLACLRERVAIGVVGTRNPTNESLKIARGISADLAAAGAVVISGGALGIDSAAHEGAMLGGGQTVCVLGCGLGSAYLRANEALRRAIRAHGAVVTEFPPFTDASRFTFPIRNRIISGLSGGVLVVEAGSRSGSLITARFAAEQGREVFAIPGSVLTSAYKGCNDLIRDGACAVTGAEDILEPFLVADPGCLNPDAVGTTPISLHPKPGVAATAHALPRTAAPAAVTPQQPQKIKKDPVLPLDPDAAAVYNLFGSDPLHPDEISAETGLSPNRLIPILMQLTLSDLIEQTEGGCYICK